MYGHKSVENEFVSLWMVLLGWIAPKTIITTFWLRNSTQLISLQISLWIHYYYTMCYVQLWVVLVCLIETFMNFFSELFFSRSHQNKVDHSEYFNFSAQSLGPIDLIRKLWAFEIMLLGYVFWPDLGWKARRNLWIDLRAMTCGYQKGRILVNLHAKY